MDRRGFLGRIASVVAGWILGARFVQRNALAQQKDDGLWEVRRVLPGDEDELVGLMKSCVESQDSFHGLCNAVEWTRSWAEGVVCGRPQSIVATLDGAVVGYFDLPSTAPKIIGDDDLDRHQRAFWCGAAGVRMDVLGEERAVHVFQELLYEAFSDAMSLGYETVRAAAPWDWHPYLPKPFKEYSGISVEPFQDEEGATKYLLEWNLKDAIEALAPNPGGLVSRSHRMKDVGAGSVA